MTTIKYLHIYLFMYIHLIQNIYVIINDFFLRFLKLDDFSKVLKDVTGIRMFRKAKLLKKL